ncbi:MAG: glycoside hydrolase family 13 protein [candidate division KSB1 bacterium]|nr:glycoside hydrolase family 13 protein [candidate division KSB1 bacterium]MDZ7301869.1 glycoside hydrolase family 13 protein [candidate division KSB1 bacterium]MDZ7310252.1 glycoside hydrolase family 13 protein [candidate division KSB1 bacterium]
MIPSSRSASKSCLYVKRWVSSTILLFLLPNLVACQSQPPAPVTTPEWAQGAIWYQIFPERFRNGDPKNDPTPEDAGIENYPGWQISPWTADWYKLQPWEKAKSSEFYKIVFDRRYGGDLQGVIEKLDYLQDLGITAIYFNPIFEAKSLHKYDASSYHHIDDNFGPDPARDKALMATETEDPATWKWTTADSLFLHFIREAHRRNIKVIIDGVFNHVGRDFWAFRDLIANQQNSRYKDWFVVRQWDDPATSQDEFKYQGWWDLRSLPVFREDHNGIVQGPREYIFAITRRWMDPDGDGDPADGVDGWRLDVSEEVSPKFWVEWCALVRSLNPQSYTIGEIWNLAPEWLQGDRYDAVMNYPVAYAMRNFFIGGEEKWGPTRFDAELGGIRAHYREATNHIMQVLIGSHDTDRLASMIKNAGSRGYDQRASCRDNMNYDPRQPNPEERKTQMMVVAFMATYVGAPMIYYGDEAGMWGGDDPDCRKPMVWPELNYENETYTTVTKFTDSDPVVFNRELFAFYQKVMSLRRHHPALRHGAITSLLKDEVAGIYAFRRDFENDIVVAVFNVSSQSQKFALNLAPINASLLREVLSGQEKNVSNAELQNELAPRSTAIWEMVK